MPWYNPFSWGKGKGDPEFNKALTMAAAGATAKQGIGDLEYKKLLLIDRELIHDDFIEQLLERKAYVPYQVKVKDGNSEKNETRYMIDWNMVALRFVYSHLNRTSFITKEEAELVKLYVESIMIRIKMQTKEHEFDLGQGNVLDALDVLARLSVDDSIDGRKARLLKTIPRVTELYVNPEEKQRKGIM